MKCKDNLLKAAMIAMTVLAIFMISTTAIAQTALEQQCMTAVQGKVAWNQAGNTTWAADNLRNLCQGTTNPSATISCFQNEIRTHNDWSRGINACKPKTATTNPTTTAQAVNKGNKARLVQVLYVIPKNQTVKPDANQAIAAIMTIIQRHYHEQLGLTFGLKDPLVTTVTIPEDVTAAVDWDKNANLIKSRLAQDYVNNENVVISILEGTTGDAGGSWNIVKMTGSFWDKAYQVYKQNPDALPNELHGWSHELGHAFGLMHTEDARACFSNNGVDLGKLPSLIMQKGADLGAVYKYPFLAQEKKLLLDPSYLPACRPLLSESGPNKAVRPHASLHLRYAQLASAPKPLGPRFIKFSHEAGYVAELTVLYHINQNLGNGVTAPMPKVEKTGNLTAGFNKRIEIPHDIATNMPIIVSIRGVGTTKNDVFSVNIPANFTGELCFKAWGTIFNAQGGKC